MPEGCYLNHKLLVEHREYTAYLESPTLVFDEDGSMRACGFVYGHEDSRFEDGDYFCTDKVRQVHLVNPSIDTKDASYRIPTEAELRAYRNKRRTN